MELTSRQFEATSLLEAIELCFEQRWTDGLPVVPPVLEKVEEMIAYAGRDPQEVIGEIPPKHGIATIEKLAVNCVMAGCKPEYFPVVIAAVQAMLADEHNLNGVQTTTHCCVPLVIVGGPVVEEIGVNAGDGVFGSGYRANGTIGRAVRLILWNLGGNLPGEVDKSTFAHPGKWSYCIGENQRESPWPAFHEDRGFSRETNTVTVFSCEAPHSILGGAPAQQTLDVIATCMTTLGANNPYFMGQTLVLFNPANAQELESHGWSKRDVQTYLWERARLPLHRLRTSRFFKNGAIYWPRWLDQQNEAEMVPMTRRPEDILVLVAGGGTGVFCMLCPGWGDHGGFAVTREVKRPARSSSIADPRRAQQR